MSRGTLVAGLWIALATPSPAEAVQPAPQVGDTYEITKSYETSESGIDGSSSSSRGKDVIVERVVGVRADGLELEYDLPKDASSQNRRSTWQFPVRVFRSSRGAVQLLNSAELETRIDAWLKEARLPRAACGQWIFTWNAFKIECDVQSVIETLGELVVATPDVREDVPYQEVGAVEPAPLVRTEGPDGSRLVATMKADPVAFRKSRAETDVVASKITGRPITIEDALRLRAEERISGTIVTSFEIGRDGSIWRKTTVTRLETRKPDGDSETNTATNVLERRRVSQIPLAPPPPADSSSAETDRAHN